MYFFLLVVLEVDCWKLNSNTIVIVFSVSNVHVYTYVLIHVITQNLFYCHILQINRRISVNDFFFKKIVWDQIYVTMQTDAMSFTCCLMVIYTSIKHDYLEQILTAIRSKVINLNFSRKYFAHLLWLGKICWHKYVLMCRLLGEWKFSI